MAEYNQDQIEEVRSQIESERLSTEGEEEELARMMATRCLADEIHTVDINGQQTNRDNLLEVNSVRHRARAVGPSNEGDAAMIKLESMFVNPIIHGSTSTSTAANLSSASTGNSSSTSASGKKQNENENENENETEYHHCLPTSKLSQLREKHPLHFQMCEYYTAAASCAERLSRSNLTISSHSQLLSNVIRARKQEAKASLHQQKQQEKERLREEAREREGEKKMKEKRVADIMRLGHKCVLKRRVLQDVHKEAWGLERKVEGEREKGVKMERVREALAKANTAGSLNPSEAKHLPNSATVSQKRASERSNQAPTKGLESKRGETTRELKLPSKVEPERRSMLDRVCSWRNSEEREWRRLERGRRSTEKLEMWERKWLEEHPEYVSDWECEGEGGGNGDEWVGGRGMWEGF